MPISVSGPAIAAGPQRRAGFVTCGSAERLVPLQTLSQGPLAALAVEDGRPDEPRESR